MFPRPLNQYSNLKRQLFCENQRNYVYCLPIDFFYFEDFRWSFFGKIKGQKYYFESAFPTDLLSRETEVMLRQECTSYILDTFVLFLIQLLVTACTHQR